MAWVWVRHYFCYVGLVLELTAKYWQVASNHVTWPTPPSFGPRRRAGEPPPHFNSEKVSVIGKWAKKKNDFFSLNNPLKFKNFISNFQTSQSNGNYTGQFTGLFLSTNISCKLWQQTGFYLASSLGGIATSKSADFVSPLTVIRWYSDTWHIFLKYPGLGFLFGSKTSCVSGTACMHSAWGVVLNQW